MLYIAIGQLPSGGKPALQNVLKREAKVKSSGLSKGKYLLVGSNKVVLIVEAKDHTQLLTALYRVPDIQWEIHPALELTDSVSKVLAVCNC